MRDDLFQRLQKRAADQGAQRRLLEDRVRTSENRLQEIQKEVNRRQEARELLIAAAKVSRERTIGFVEKIVTQALISVFEDKTLRFVIETHERRGQLEADYKIEWISDGVTVRDDPMAAKGGALWDTISTALRLIFLIRFRPRKRQILFLDEPGKFIKRQRLERYARWLRKITKKFGVQAIIVSHEEDVWDADLIYHFRKDARGAVQVRKKKIAKSHEGYGFNKELPPTTDNSS